MQDALSGKVGKSRSDSMGWEYLWAHGPVGGSHYLISELKEDGSPGTFGSKVVTLQPLSSTTSTTASTSPKANEPLPGKPREFMEGSSRKLPLKPGSCLLYRSG